MAPDGLQIHFTIMLYAGLATLVVMLFLLVLRAVRREKLVPLLPFFAIPIVLMGFPFIETIKINREGFELARFARIVAEHPDSAAARAELTELVAKAEARDFSGPGRLLDIANAELALGNVESAMLYADRVLEIDPQSVQAQAIKVRVDAGVIDPRRIEGLVRRLEESPTDPGAKEAVREMLSGIEAAATGNADLLLLAARARAALGETETALRLVKATLELRPDSPEAHELRERLGERRAAGPTAGRSLEEVAELVDKVRSEPRDAAARAELRKRLEEHERAGAEDPDFLRLAIEAWAELKERERAARAAELLRRVDPGNPDLSRLVRKYDL